MDSYVLGLVIELVQSYPHLYDLTHRSYKNNKVKEQSWSEIAQINVNDAKRLWKDVRDRYLREKRDKPSGSGASDSQWVYFDKMAFYSKYAKTRKTATATPAPSTSRPQSAGSSSSSRPLSAMDFIMSPEPELDLQEEHEELRDETPVAVTPTPESTPQTGPRQSRKRKADSAELELIGVAKKIASNIEPHKKSVNESFGDYVVSRLEEMGVEEAKQKRREMLLILEDECI